MAKLKFDKVEERFYETGVDHGVLYPMKNGTYQDGVVWNGLTSVASNPSGAEDSPYYADNIKYFSMRSAEEYGLTIGCFYYPDEFKQCNGEAEPVDGLVLGQQRRSTFGFSYRTKLGNSESQDHGFKIHVVYGCSASPSSVTYNSVNESPEPGEMSYEVTTTPVDVPGKDAEGKPYKPTAEITFDSSKLSAEKMAIVERVLYGTDDTSSSTDSVTAGPRLPLPEEWLTILADSDEEISG